MKSSISCETFATALLLPIEDNNFLPIQDEIIAWPKGYENDKNEALEEFQKFKGDLRKRIGMVPDGVLMTLEYYLQAPEDKGENDIEKCPAWILTMEKEYEEFFAATARYC